MLFVDEPAAVGGGPLVAGDHLFAGFVAHRTDDQRRSRFVDEHAVRLVDECEVGAPLHGLFAATFQPLLAGLPQDVVLSLAHAAEQKSIAEEIKAEFLGRPVGDVARVRGAALVRLVWSLNHANGEAEHFVDRPHPFSVAGGQVVVDRGEVAAAANERMKVHRQCGGERFSFARAHFGEAAVEQAHPANQLDIEMPHLQRASARFPHERIGFGH